MTYSEDIEPWAAFDIGWYEQGHVSCGDDVLLVFETGTLRVKAWDAGTFRGYWVEDFGSGVPILVDLPEHLRPDGQMSWPVVIVNLSKVGLDE